MAFHRRWIAYATVLFLTAVTSVAGSAGAFAADAPIPAGAAVDQFSSTALGSDWSVLNGDPAQWSLRDRPGYLRLHATAGDTWQDTNSAKNLFLQDIPAGDFQVVAKFDAPVALDFQSAGLLAWQDTDNYVRAGLAHVGFAGGNVVENGLEVGAKYSSTFTGRPDSTAEVLKLARTGKVFTTSYWSGTAWVQAAQVTADLNVQEVGIYAFAAQNGTSFDADFDYVAVASAAAQAVVPAAPFTLDTGTTFLAGSASGTVVASNTRAATQLTVRAVDATAGTVALKDEAGGGYLTVAGSQHLHLAAKSSGTVQRFTLLDAGGGRVRVAGSEGYLALSGSTVTGGASAAAATRWYIRPYGVTQGDLKVDLNAAGKQISDRLHGLFFEDINQAADGGLYAELVRNRSFEFEASDRAGYTGLTGWETLQRGGATGTVAVATDQPLNANNLHYLRLAGTSAGSGGAAGLGVRNGGFNTGIVVQKGARYNFSVWARSTATGGTPITVRVESADGTSTYATASVTTTGSGWKKYAATLTATDTTTAGRLVVLAPGTGTLDLDMVSLFPKDTFKDRSNGMRPDIAKLIADLHPHFLRFPGGCVVNTRSYDRFPARQRVYQWKDTIGPVEQRPTNANFWGYNQTYGLGYYEYFQFAEDIGAQPLAVVPAGVTGCGDNPSLPADKRDEYVQDTLDMIEFANGASTTKYGSIRAQMGHPKPFGLKYVEVGNEEYKDGFYANFPYFLNAIRAKNPDIKVISNAGPASLGAVFDKGWQFARDQKADIVDEHYYNSPEWFLANTHRYDNYDRSGPKVFIGEYASHGNTFGNAVAEAAYLTGVERNGDVVELASYAPLLATPDNVQWTPDMIWFDNHRVYASANYYVQKMFSTNQGDRLVPSSFSAPDAAIPPIAGKVGLATWNTQVAYDDVKVTGADGKVLLADDFAGDAQWTPDTGTWSVAGGAYAQTSGASPAKSTAGSSDWSNYTMEVTARKTSGSEGFLVMFGAGDPGHYYWWNLGGWGNSRSAIQKINNGDTVEIANSAETIETGRTYHLKVEVRGRTIRTYLDGRKVNEVTDGAVEPLYQVTTRDSGTGEAVLKVVNGRDTAVRSGVTVAGHTPATAEVTTLTAASTSDTNSFTEPTKVAPAQSTLRGVAGRFTYDFPANSVTFIRFGTTSTPPTPGPQPRPTPTVSSSAPVGHPSSSSTPASRGGGTTTGALPRTGEPIALIAAMGVATLAVGILLYVVARRRRARATP